MSLDNLASQPVGRLLWQYSLPAVVGMLVMAMYNIVDRIFIGQVVGPEAIAGMALTFPLMNITTAIGVLVGVGSSSRISILLGRGDKPASELMLGNAATLTLVNAAIYIAIFATWIDPILRAFGAGDITLPYARSYMLWVLPGLLLTNVAFGLNNVLRSTGYPTRAMMTMIIGAVANVILDAILVLWLDMGMAGAAIATDIAMALSAWFVVSHFMRHDVNLRFRRGTFTLRAPVVMSMMALGAAPCIINVASCMVNALINRSLVTHGGDMAIGAAGIFVTYTSLLVTIVLGICMGLQPVIGYNYGAGMYHRLRRAYWLAVAVSTAICTIGCIAGLTIPSYIARAFTSDAFLIDSTVVCLRHALWAFAVVGFQVISTTYFQSVGAPARAMVLSLARQVIFLIPLMLILSRHMGVEGVWLSFPISDLLATAVTAALIIPSLRSFADAGRKTPSGNPKSK
ncbi:MAG: MATE family efflux transporter [Muribaculaceae bacterium]|nr:MATE family efflux transporter [Muribaculaceae bacterium]